MTFAFVTPADELQIRNLIARYAYAIDGGEKETFASLFLEDGAWTGENGGPGRLGRPADRPRTDGIDGSDRNRDY